MLEFEVGAIPSQPISIAVRDEMDNPVNLIGYSGIRLEMLGQNGEPVDLSGILVQQVTSVIGGITVVLPRDRSLFSKKGIYTLRVVLETPGGQKDITRTGEIKVREFGRIK